MNRGRITKLAFGIVILCFVLSTFVSLWSLRLMAKQNMRELSKALAARIYDTISGELSEPVIVGRTMANDSFLIDLLQREDSLTEAEAAQAMKPYLSGLRDGLAFEAAFVVSEGSRRYYTFEGVSKTVDPEGDERDGWYADFLEKGVTYDLDVDRDEFARDAWTVFVDTRIQDAAGKLLGVCGVGMRMTGSQALFIELEREYGVDISLVAPDGLVKVDTEEANIEAARWDDISLSAGSDYLFQKLGRNRYVVTKYIENLGWYLVVQTDGRNETGQFINVIVLNIVLCLLVMVILVIAIRIIIERTRALSNASFRDQTTQLLNRRAFEEAKARLEADGMDESFAYVTADVNGLKTANDDLGHAAGDELIQGAALCLKECFGKFGDVYRIGGDEFAAMLKISPERLAQAMEELEQLTAAWSGERVDSLSISCGFAMRQEFPSENIGEISRISDERMYAAKAEHYRRIGKDRRRT